MARIVPLCSSSKGNSVFIGDTSEGVLVDVGCSFKALRERLSLCGIPFEAIKAVVITHEHSDHIKGLLQLTKQTDLPIYASGGTIRYLTDNGCIDPSARLYDCDELNNAPTDIRIEYFHTPHDAAESVGYTFTAGEHKIACCTDLGYVTDEVRGRLIGCSAVYIEANYDKKLLDGNVKYPPFLKARIASNKGHLANADCSDFCAELIAAGATRLVLGHLSQENNTPQTAYSAVSDRLSKEGMRCGADYTLDIAPVVSVGKYIVL